MSIFRSLKVNRRRGKLRRETLHGKDYLVVPVRMLITGVLNGSRGRLFYPQNEINANRDAWNNMPVCVGHPKHGGKYVSARSPAKLEEYQIGMVLNTKGGRGPLDAEAWIDIDLANNIEPRLIPAVRKGFKVNVSVGVFSKDIPQRGTYRGKPFDAVATKLRADHLAILLDEPGACSVADGCGINVNGSLRYGSEKRTAFDKAYDRAKRRKKKGKLNTNEKKLYFFEGRNTAVVAGSAAEARRKKKRGGDKIVSVRKPNDSDKKAIAKGRWTRTRKDGKSPDKSKYGKGRGYGPARNSRATNSKGKECWDGYERVPGTKRYDKGSCRKKSKKKGFTSGVTVNSGSLLETLIVNGKLKGDIMPNRKKRKTRSMFDVNLSDQDREDLIEALVSNCECENDHDEGLAYAEADELTDNALVLIANSLHTDDDDDFDDDDDDGDEEFTNNGRTDSIWHGGARKKKKKMTGNMSKKKKMGKMRDQSKDEGEDLYCSKTGKKLKGNMGKKKMVANSEQMSEDDWFASAPESVQSMLSGLMDEQEELKEELVSNVLDATDEFEEDELYDMPLKTLRKLERSTKKQVNANQERFNERRNGRRRRSADRMPARSNSDSNRSPRRRSSGRGQQRITNNSRRNGNRNGHEILIPPTINFESGRTENEDN